MKTISLYVHLISGIMIFHLARPRFEVVDDDDKLAPSDSDSDDVPALEQPKTSGFPMENNKRSQPASSSAPKKTPVPSSKCTRDDYAIRCSVHLMTKSLPPQSTQHPQRLKRRVCRSASPVLSRERNGLKSPHNQLRALAPLVQHQRKKGLALQPHQATLIVRRLLSPYVLCEHQPSRPQSLQRIVPITPTQTKISILMTMSHHPSSLFGQARALHLNCSCSIFSHVLQFLFSLSVFFLVRTEFRLYVARSQGYCKSVPLRTDRQFSSLRRSRDVTHY